jgi:UDP-glucose 4-epimerase
LAGQKAVIYGDGEQTRDFTFVGDVVKANLAALEYSDIGAFMSVPVLKPISMSCLTL